MFDLECELLKTESGQLIDGPLLINPKVFNDQRGYFYESWNKKIFDDLIKTNLNFVQDNHSRSSIGVLRGLHYQLPPFSQGKLVRCILGSVFDVAVDLRIDSLTFGKWVGVELSQSNKKQFWLPDGFAHGFLTISQNAEVQYKTTQYWNKESERTILWNDIDINISWPLESIVYSPILAQKDANAPTFQEVLLKGDLFT